MPLEGDMPPVQHLDKTKSTLVTRRSRKSGRSKNSAARDEQKLTTTVETPKSSQRKPTIAVIGLGYWGPNLVRNFHKVAGTNLRACFDQEDARVASIASEFPSVQSAQSVEAILKDRDIDAVAIATPVNTHYEIAKAALLAGKSVLVEKPMTDSIEHSEELIDLAERMGLVLMVDHIFVYSPPVLMMKELVDSGQLGDLLFIDSVRINLGMFRRDVNVVWDLAPHDLSIVDHLTGKMPRSVSAFGGAHTENGHEDVAYLNLDFGDGLIANFHVNWLSPVKLRYTMLGGAKKSLVYNDLDQMEKIKVYDSGITVRDDDLEQRRGLMIDYRAGDIWSPHVPRTEPLRTMAEHFLDCVANDRTPITDGEAGLRVVRILDAAQRSIKAQGGRITL
jgi:predicted dehydrogenase